MKAFVIALVTVFYSMSFAATAVEAIRQSQTLIGNINRDLTSQELVFSKQKSDLANLEQRIKENSDYLKQNSTEYDKKKGGFSILGWEFGRSSLDDDFTKGYAEKQRELARLKDQRTGALAALDEDEMKISKMRADLIAAQRDEKEKTEELEKARAELMETALNVSNLTRDFQALDAKFENVGLKLDLVKEKYDNAMLGAYLQDRMAGLLNSDAFCTASKSCEGTRAKINPSDLSGVFPGMKKSSSSSQQQVAPPAAAKGVN
jgi:septal ring factor EnvC (AmiA/AmiB activator)